MSPNERVFLSDTTNQQDTSPFNSKFPILRFNSGNKSSNAKSSKSKKSQNSSINGENKKPKRLIDFQINGPIIGQGIFKTPETVGQSSTNTSCYSEAQMNNIFGTDTSNMFKPPPIPTYNKNPFAGVNDEENQILPPKKARKISKIPFKVLDAPSLRDDFYLNLVDWSDTNNLAVGLQ